MSMQQAKTVMSRLNMQPMMISVSHAEAMSDAIRQLASCNTEQEESERDQAAANMLAAYGYGYSTGERKPFVYADGIAFIPVSGLLINRFSYSWGWVTGYNFIRVQLNAALEDDDVRLIVFDCNSGGGEVAGCFELCADIRASREKKPSLAVVDSSSFSACYAIASSASQITVTPSGAVGSVGVVATHVDYSKYFADSGIKIQFIFSGDHKVDGNPYEPLPEPVRVSIQARVDATRKEFVTLVAENRGLEAEKVHETQARCFSAQQGLELGLIDAIAPPLEAVRAFFNSESETEETMSGTTEKPGAESATALDSTAQTVDTAKARADERQRIEAITSNAEAKDRPSLASHLALKTDMSVEQAVAILSASAKEVSEAATSSFEAAMDADRHPNISAEDSGEGSEMTAAQRILRDQAFVTGQKLK